MERTYTIPLRKAALKAPQYQRTNRAVKEVRLFLQRHMKTKEVRIGEKLNESLWARGDHHPPSRVTVLVKKEDDVSYAELVGHDFKKKNFGEEAEAPKKAPAAPKKEAKTTKEVKAAAVDVEAEEKPTKAQ